MQAFYISFSPSRWFFCNTPWDHPDRTHCPSGRQLLMNLSVEFSDDSWIQGGGCHCLPLGPHRPIGNPSNTFNPPSSPNALPNFNFIYNFNFSRNPLPSTPLKTNLHNHYLGPANKDIQWEYLWTNQTAATLLLQMEWLYANRWTLLFRRLGISHHQ